MSKKSKVLWGGRPARPKYTIQMRDSLTPQPTNK